MKKRSRVFTLALSALLFSTLFAQDTTFTYQGRLDDSGGPANGSYDLCFSLHDALHEGSQSGSSLTNAAVAVSNGLFTTLLDFGAEAFTHESRWLEIAVRTNGGDTFTALSPRQKLTPTPYAIYSAGAGTAANFSGTLSGNGSGLTNLNGENIQAGTINNNKLDAATRAVLDSAVTAQEYTNIANAAASSASAAYSSTNTLLPASGYVHKYMPVPELYLDTWNVFTSIGSVTGTNYFMNWATNAILDLKSNGVLPYCNIFAIDGGWTSGARDANGNITWRDIFGNGGLPGFIQFANTNGFKVWVYGTLTTNICDPFSMSIDKVNRDVKYLMSLGVEGMHIDNCGGLSGAPLSRYYTAYMRELERTIAEYHAAVSRTNGRCKPFQVYVTIANGEAVENTINRDTVNGFNVGAIQLPGFTPGAGMHTTTNMVLASKAILAQRDWIGPGHYFINDSIYTYYASRKVVTNALATACLTVSPIQFGVGNPANIPTVGEQFRSHFGNLTNTEVMSILRDPYCIPARIVYSNELKEIWSRPLGGPLNDTAAIGLINLAPTNAEMTVSLSDFGGTPGTTYVVRDPFTRSNIATFTQTAQVTAYADNVRLLKVFPYNGTFTGNGSSLTNLHGANIQAGTINSNQFDEATRAMLGGGLTTNVAVLVSGGRTNTLCFTNGVLRAVR